jgi:hypothetical protein
MIKVLGAKRLIVIAVIVALNAVLAGVLYGYLQPKNGTLIRDLRSTQSLVGSKRSEIGRLRVEYQQIQEEKEFFGGLENAGFFSDQDRVLARRRMQEIIDQSRVLSARYNISPRAEVANEKAKQANHVELSSPISVNIDAVDDADFYNFLYLVENAFPGQTSVQAMSLERVMDVNEAVLRSVGTGVNPVLVRGKIDFVWKTLVPLATMQEQNAGGL